MTIVVPYDHSERSRRALERAEEFAAPTETVIAVTAIPNGNERYARERGWLDHDEPFEPELIVRRLTQAVSKIDPDARFEYVVTSRYAQPGQIASELRSFAREQEARLVVLGSENAGRVVSSVSSVASTVTAGSSYDVLIVREN